MPGREQFRQHSSADAAISRVTLFELEYGAQKSQHIQRAQEALARFLSPFTLLEIDHFTATKAAVIRAKLKKNSTPIGPYNLLIAVLALVVERHRIVVKRFRGDIDLTWPHYCAIIHPHKFKYRERSYAGPWLR